MTKLQNIYLGLSRSSRRTLRSSHRSLLYVSTNINTATYGERAYSYASTKLWNALPDYFKSCDTVCAFKTALKTYPFKEVYDC